MPTPKAKLTAKQALFVAEYLIDLNATQAAIRAGYSARTARQAGAECLSKPVVAEAIQDAQAKRAEKLEITASWVLEELAKLARANMQDYMAVDAGGDPTLNFADLTRDQAAALQEVSVETYMEGRGAGAREVKRVKFKLADKRASLVDVGRHLGMFTDKVQHSGSLTIKRASDMTDDEIAERLASKTAK